MCFEMMVKVLEVQKSEKEKKDFQGIIEQEMDVG